jgi:CHRD domain
MPDRRNLVIGSLGLVAAGLAGPVFAQGPGRALFSVALRGDAPPANTNSTATGVAAIVVDLAAQTVDLDMRVSGIKLAQLWDKLKAAPIGPVHLHHYGDMRHMNDASVTLVMPVPFGPMYADSPSGFTVSMKAFPYAKGAALLGSKVPFDDFMASMRGGLLALNVHTNAFPDGEINGPVIAKA